MLCHCPPLISGPGGGGGGGTTIHVCISYSRTCCPSGYGFSPSAHKQGIIHCIQRFSKILYKQGLKITHFDEKISGI